MAKKSLKWLALLGGVTIAATAAVAQDSGALLDALVKKGVLNDQEAEEIRADLTRDFAAALPKSAAPGSRNVSKLAITGRVQAQWETFETDADGGAADPTSVNAFNLRRVRIGATADFGSDFRGMISYDLVSNNLDAATIRWNQSEDLTIDAGFRKVNFGYEEYTSSARLKAIERSAVTRYFVEGHNNRRFGAGSRRVGVFADGKAGDFFYGAAVTNVNRQDNPGRQGNNDIALWANAGYKGKLNNGSFTVGSGLGYLPDQRNNAGALQSDEALTVASLFADVNVGSFTTVAEVLYSDTDAVTPTANGSNSWGFYIQPSFALTKEFELVARYTYLDTDGRGVQVSDIIPGASNVGTSMDTATEIYLGMNYYFKSNDVKFSAGFVHAKLDDDVAGGAVNSVKVNGIRTQMQVSF